MICIRSGCSHQERQILCRDLTLNNSDFLQRLFSQGRPAHMALPVLDLDAHSATVGRHVAEGHLLDGGPELELHAGDLIPQAG